MKRIALKFVPHLCILCLLVFTVACGDSKTSGSSTSTAESSNSVGSTTSGLSSSTDVTDNGEVKFTLDGAQWVSGPPGHPDMNFEEEAITDGNTMVRIEAFAGDGSYFALTVFSASGVGVGTYPITGQGMSGFYKKDFEAGDGYVTTGMTDNPGAVTISRLTADEVEGTFQFAIRSAGDPEKISQITNGSFNVRFTKI